VQPKALRPGKPNPCGWQKGAARWQQAGPLMVEGSDSIVFHGMQRNSTARPDVLGDGWNNWGAEVRLGRTSAPPGACRLIWGERPDGGLGAAKGGRRPPCGRGRPRGRSATREQFFSVSIGVRLVTDRGGRRRGALRSDAVVDTDSSGYCLRRRKKSTSLRMRKITLSPPSGTFLAMA
jgi:hypothetical protein